MLISRVFHAVIVRVYPRIAFRGAKVGKRVYAMPRSSLYNPDRITFGDDCYIGPGCRIEAWCEYGEKCFSPEITLGREVKINSRCHIGAINRVEIGDQCLLGSNVMITDHSHGNSSMQESSIPPTNRPLYSKGPVVIGSRVWIGENVVILPGVRIGESAIVGANAVVTKDIPGFVVAAGNPARVVKKLKNVSCDERNDG